MCVDVDLKICWDKDTTSDHLKMDNIEPEIAIVNDSD
jgi:hypothetical protein